MAYPNTLTHFQNGLSLYIPIEKEVKFIYEELVTVKDDTPFPFWAKIWPASIALTNFLQSNTQWIENKKVLEIGAGIGLPSFSIATIAKEVVVSDYCLEAVTLMQKNIQYLRLTNTKAFCIDWKSLPIDIQADTLLLSDVNYAPNEFESLLNFIENCLTKGIEIIIATPQRMLGIPFVEKINPFILQESSTNVLENNQEINIRIYVLKR